MANSFRSAQQFGPCAERGCQRPIRARGFCWPCYQRLRLQGKLTKEWRPAIENPADPSSRLIPLGRGLFAIVDAEVAEVVSRWRWSVRPSNRTNYAQRMIGRGRALTLHRFLWLHFGLPETPEIDHENGNGLDCRRSNLRAATHSQNMWNRRTPRSNTSGVKGVGWDKRRARWRAEVRAGSRRCRRRFDTLAEAVAFVAAARAELHGEFARET